MNREIKLGLRQLTTVAGLPTEAASALCQGYGGQVNAGGSGVIAPGYNNKSLKFLCIKCILVVAILAGITTPALAVSNIYVATNGLDTRNGADYWTNAVATISNGIAHASTAGDTVWVSNGAYVLSAQLSITRAITVSAWSANAADTIIDGGYPATTNRCVNISAAATLNGFTISNGMANGNDGGGIYMGNSSCIVTNCIITLNQANSLGVSDYGRGGGIFIANGSNMRTVSDCLFAYNLSSLTQAYYTLYLDGGAGLFCDGWGRISNCRFVSNVATKNAGGGGGGGLGISARSGLNCIVSNCTFDGNNAANGGGLCAYGAANSSIQIIDCAFSNNSVTNSSYDSECMGGGIYAYRGIVSNCVMAWNQAGKNSGGMYLYGATGVNCVIKENLARGYESGGISMAGGALLLNSSVLNNTNVIGTGGTVGGVYMRGTTSRTILRNCLIAGNKSCGVTIHTTDGTNSVVQNCTIVFNYDGGVVYIGSNSSGNIIYYNTGYNWHPDITYYVSNSCTTPTNSKLIGTGNIQDAPQFVDTNSGNYRLITRSPCVNAGSSESWMTNAVDRDGRARLRYGRIDIGAYEVIYSGFVFSAY